MMAPSLSAHDLLALDANHRDAPALKTTEATSKQAAATTTAKAGYCIV